MFFVFIGVCIAISITCHFLVKRNKERQRQLLEASEQLPLMVQQAMSSLPTEADMLRSQQEQKQLEAFGSKFDALAESGEIRSHEDMYNERITCANGHHFLLMDFLGGGQGGCCPMCKTSAFTFDDPNARRYFYCPCVVIGVMRIHERILKAQGGTFTQSDVEPYVHWFHDEESDCPLCRWVENQGMEVTRAPLTNIALNIEKIKARQGATK